MDAPSGADGFWSSLVSVCGFDAHSGSDLSEHQLEFILLQGDPVVKTFFGKIYPPFSPVGSLGNGPRYGIVSRSFSSRR